MPDWKTMTLPMELEGFDVPGAVERMLNQPGLWREALSLFVSHFSDWESTWASVVGNIPAERRQVHAVRSAAANVGAVRLAEAAKVLEEVLSSQLAGGGSALSDSRRQLTQVFRQTLAIAAGVVGHPRPG